MNYNQQHLRDWLLQRPLIKIRALEEVSGCPIGTIRHFLKERRNIREPYIDAITKSLTLYGFIALGDE